MGLSSFLKSQVNRKFRQIKEDFYQGQEREDVSREARHREQITSAPARAKAIENVRLQQDIKEIKRGGGKSGWRQGVENFAANMSKPGHVSGGRGGGGSGANMDWILGDMGGGGRRSGKKHRKTKSKKGKRKR